MHADIIHLRKFQLDGTALPQILIWPSVRHAKALCAKRLLSPSRCQSVASISNSSRNVFTLNTKATQPGFLQIHNVKAAQFLAHFPPNGYHLFNFSCNLLHAKPSGDWMGGEIDRFSVLNRNIWSNYTVGKSKRLSITHSVSWCPERSLWVGEKKVTGLLFLFDTKHLWFVSCLRFKNI